MSFTFGNRPEDVVTDSKGNTLSGVINTFYPTEADADARTSPLGSATSTDGVWTFTSDLPLIWVRTPAGKVYPISSAEASVADFTDQVNAAKDSAATSATAAQAAQNAAEAAATLVNAPADAAVAAIVGNPASATATALSAAYGTKAEVAAKAEKPAFHFDSAAEFFPGVWAAGQGIATTTLTADAAAGATTLAVADGTAYVNGTVITTWWATTARYNYTVTAGGGTNTLTISPPLVAPMATGITISPLWTNEYHLTGAGYRAFTNWFLNHKDAHGEFSVPDPGARKVVWLGNSWAVGASSFALDAGNRFPTATIVSAGVSGNTSAQLLARFDTDVPDDSAIVYFNEPGVNDIIQGVSTATMSANLQALIAKCHAIGAIPVYTGVPPLALMPTQAAAAQAALRLAQPPSPAWAWEGILTDGIPVLKASTTTAPVDVVAPPTATNPSTQWTQRRTSTDTQMKGTTDTAARLTLTYNNGRIYFGNGVATPTAYVSPSGTTGVLFGANVVFAAANTYDIGSDATKARNIWCYAIMRPIASTAVSLTLTASHSTVIFTGASLTATLPDPATVVNGREYVIKNTNAAALTVVSAGTSKTIDGAASQSLAQWASARYISDSSAWYSIA